MQKRAPQVCVAIGVPFLFIRPGVEEQDAYGKAVREERLKQANGRGADQRNMTNEQMQRSTRTVWWRENGGNEWETEIGRDK